MHRLVFILFMSFTTLLALVGSGSFYLARLSGLVQEILQINQFQLQSLNEFSDRFVFLSNANNKIVERAKNRLIISIDNDIENTLNQQIKIENLLGQLERYYVWANAVFDDVSFGLSDEEVSSIKWLKNTINLKFDDGSFPRQLEARAVENDILLNRSWRVRITAQNKKISDFGVKIYSFQYRLIIFCFSVLTILFFFMYVWVIRPMISQFYESERLREQKLSLQKEISATNASIVNLTHEEISSQSNLMAAVEDVLAHSEYINAVRPSYTERSCEEIESEPNMICSPLRSFNSDYKNICFLLPDHLLDVKSDLSVLAYSLANYFGILSENALRLEAETQRDTYHQIAEEAIKSLPNPVAIFDAMGVSVICNPAFIAYFNIVESSPPLLSSVSAMHNALCVSTQDNGRDFFEEGRLEQSIFSYKDNASFIWTRIPIFEVGPMFIGQDITVAKKSVQEKEHQIRLQELGRISGTVAHDSNNFLSVIMGSLEFLKLECQFDGAQSAILDQAVETCLKASKINKQLVSYTRVQNLVPEYIEFPSIAEIAFDFVRANAGADIKFNVRLDSERLVFVDRAYLSSALCNLLKNSIESLKSIGVIDLSFSESDSGMVQIIIQDNGAGFSQQALEKGVIPFFSEKSIGAGLGLAAVDGFARQSGGSLSLMNDGGAKVVLSLPSKINVEHYGSKYSYSNEGKSNILEGKSVLILEDNVQLGQLLCRFLEGLGCQITYIETVDAAERQLHSLPMFEFILSDVLLKGETCFDVVRKMSEQQPNARVIYMTGYGSREFTRSIRDLSVHLVEKPFSLSSLQAALEKSYVGTQSVNPGISGVVA